MQALERDLLNRTRDLKKQSDSHAKVVTVIHTMSRYIHYSVWSTLGHDFKDLLEEE